MKKYQVMFQDEYNNLYHLGFFNGLKDCLDDVNKMLEPYKDQMLDDYGNHIEFKPLTEFDLVEYASTFGVCFDKEIYLECGAVFVRGFTFYEIEEELKDV